MAPALLLLEKVRRKARRKNPGGGAGARSPKGELIIHFMVGVAWVLPLFAKLRVFGPQQGILFHPFEMESNAELFFIAILLFDSTSIPQITS